MPLIVCPSCEKQPPMQAVQRHSVEFDVCTQCRGVWLDRGELEKLLEATREVREERQSFDRDRDDFYRDPDDYRRKHPQPQRWGHGEHDRDIDPRTGRPRKRWDIFDIFD